LLIITNTPTAAAYGGVESLLRPTLEEHLLERISSLESQLERAQDRLELVLDLVHRQATSGLYDHAMLDALVEHLSERGAVEGGKLETLWRDRIAEHYEEASEQEEFDKRIERMLGGFGGENFDLFARVGYGHQNVRISTPTVSASTGNDTVNFGVGVQYFFSKNDGFRAEATRFQHANNSSGDVNTYSISYVRKF